MSETVPVIGIDGKMTCARLHYTQDYFTPGIGHVMKRVAMEKWMSFPTKIHTVML